MKTVTMTAITAFLGPVTNITENAYLVRHNKGHIQRIQKPFYMERLIAYISGNIQKVSYRARVVDLARAFNLTGLVENLKDGRVKIIAEGNHDMLSRFEEAISINDHLIQVSRVEKEYYPASGGFNGFYFADPGEIEYDQQEVLELIENVKAMVDIISNLDRKMDLLLENQEKYSAGFDAMVNRIEEKNEILNKKAEMLDLKATLRERGIILIGLASFGSSIN
jgi:acylphosphatase